MASENPLSKAALAQALMYHFKVDSGAIGRMIHSSTANICSYTTSDDAGGVLPWWRRTLKEESIAAAEKILRETWIVH
jgi:hypothetical protein